MIEPPRGSFSAHRLAHHGGDPETLYRPPQRRRGDKAPPSTPRTSTPSALSIPPSARGPLTAPLSRLAVTAAHAFRADTAQPRTASFVERKRGITMAVMVGNELVAESAPVTPSLTLAPPVSALPTPRSPGAGAGKEIILCRYYHTPGLTCTSSPCRFVHNVHTFWRLNGSTPLPSPNTAGLQVRLSSSSALLSSIPITTIAEDLEDPTSGTFAAAQSAAPVPAPLHLDDVDMSRIASGEAIAVRELGGAQCVGYVFKMSGGGKGPVGRSKAKFKTIPCKDFASGSCPYGDYCSFIHDSDNLYDEAKHAKKEDVVDVVEVVDVSTPPPSPLKQVNLVTCQETPPLSSPTSPHKVYTPTTAPRPIKTVSVLFSPIVRPKSTPAEIPVSATSRVSHNSTHSNISSDSDPAGPWDPARSPSTSLPSSPTSPTSPKPTSALPPLPDSPVSPRASSTPPMLGPAISLPSPSRGQLWAPPSDSVDDWPGMGCVSPVSPTKSSSSKGAWENVPEIVKSPRSKAKSRESVMKTPEGTSAVVEWPPLSPGLPFKPTTAKKGVWKKQGGSATEASETSEPADPMGAIAVLVETTVEVTTEAAPVVVAASPEPSNDDPSRSSREPQEPRPAAQALQTISTSELIWTPQGWVIRFPPEIRYRTKLCRFFAMGDCPRGDQCEFLHPSPGEQVNPSPPERKTMICNAFNNLGCDLTPEACPYAHIRVVFDSGPKNRNPHARTRPCRHFLAGRCHMGNACSFAHVRQPPGSGIFRSGAMTPTPTRPWMPPRAVLAAPVMTDKDATPTPSAPPSEAGSLPVPRRLPFRPPHVHAPPFSFPYAPPNTPHGPHPHSPRSPFSAFRPPVSPTIPTTTIPRSPISTRSSFSTDTSRHAIPPATPITPMTPFAGAFTDYFHRGSGSESPPAQSGECAAWTKTGRCPLGAWCSLAHVGEGGEGNAAALTEEALAAACEELRNRPVYSDADNSDDDDDDDVEIVTVATRTHSSPGSSVSRSLSGVGWVSSASV